MLPSVKSKAERASKAHQKGCYLVMWLAFGVLIIFMRPGAFDPFALEYVLVNRVIAQQSQPAVEASQPQTMLPPPKVTPWEDKKDLLITEEMPYHWNPIPSQETGLCATAADYDRPNSYIADLFPPTFEKHVYANSLLKNGIDFHSKDIDESHYKAFGRRKGLQSTRGQEMRRLLNKRVIPNLKGDALEIGPFLNPVLDGKRVKYFDVMDMEGLQDRARRIGYPSVRPVPIDFVHPKGDLKSIPSQNKFKMVLSSHAIEHQLDFVRHLQDVGNILEDGGVYFMLVPDKRLCFDHFIKESTLADILDDYYNDATKNGNHKLKSVLEHRALTTHNDVHKHWAHDHGPAFSSLKERIQQGLDEWNSAQKNNGYVDVHNYQFTPEGIAFAIDFLYHQMGLIDLQTIRLYEPVHVGLEFGLALRKCQRAKAES